MLLLWLLWQSLTQDCPGNSTKSFGNLFRLEKEPNIIGYIQQALPKIISFAHVQEMIESKFENDIIVDGIMVWLKLTSFTLRLHWCSFPLCSKSCWTTFISWRLSSQWRYELYQGLFVHRWYPVDSWQLQRLFTIAWLLCLSARKKLHKAFQKILDVIVRDNADALSGVYRSKGYWPSGSF